MDVIITKTPKSKKKKKILKGHKLIKKTTIKIKKDILVTSAGELKTTEKKGFIYNDNKSKMPATIFLIIVILLGVYVINDQFYKDKSDYNDYSYESINKVVKIDASKDYIYLEKNNEIAYDKSTGDRYEESNIVFNITLSSIRDIESKLNEETRKYHEDYEYTDENSYSVIDSKYNHDDYFLKSFKYNEYEIYKSTDYISLSVITKDINLLENSKSNFRTYVFGIKNGSIYTNEKLYQEFNTTKEELLKNIDINGEYKLFVNSNCLGIIYETEENEEGYNEYLTNFCKK